MKKIKKIGITAFKFGISILLLYFVFKKIPFSEIWFLLKNSKIYFLIFALFLFTVSQFFSSERLLSYFHSLAFDVDKKENRKLYLIGMFYNFFIPGGIGGDAYKVYVLNKKYNWSIKKLSAAVLADRLSGLMAILVLIQIFGISLLPGFYKFTIVVPILLSVWIGKVILNSFFPSFKDIFLQSLLLSFLIQILQLSAIYCILSSFASVNNIWIYFLVFLLSTLLSVLSFSGIGIREWVFMKASYYMNYDIKISVATALMFTFISAFVSLFGIYYQLRGNTLVKDTV